MPIVIILSMHTQRKMMFVINLAFIVSFLSWPCHAQRYRIERNPDGEDNFDIEPRTDTCSSYGATADTTDPNRCTCSKNTSSSFGFFNNRFRCFDNLKIRARTGCNTGFRIGSSSYTPDIQTLRLNATKSYGFINVLFPDSPCKHVGTQYQDCSGSWTPVVNYVISVRHYELYVKVTSLASVFPGKLINFQLRCTRNNTMFEDCLLFKLEGTQECFTPLQPTQVYSLNSTTAMNQSRNPPNAAAATKKPGTTTKIVETTEKSRKTHNIPFSSSKSPTASNNSTGLGPVKTEGTDSYVQEESTYSVATILGSLLASLLIVSSALVSVLVFKSRKQRGKHSFTQSKVSQPKGIIASAERMQGNLNNSFVPDGANRINPVPIYEEILDMSSTNCQNMNLKNASICGKDAFPAISPEELIQKEDRELDNFHRKLSISTSSVGRRATFPSTCVLQPEKDSLGAYDNVKDILAELGRPIGTIYEVLEGPDPNGDVRKPRAKSHPQTPETFTNIYQVLEGPQPDNTYESLGKKNSIYQTLERTKNHSSSSSCDEGQFDIDEVAV